MSDLAYTKEYFYDLSINKKRELVKQFPEYNIYLTGNKKLSAFKDKVDILTLNKQDLLKFINDKMQEAINCKDVKYKYTKHSKIINTFSFVNLALLNNNADKEVFDYLFFYAKNNNLRSSSATFETYLNNFQTLVRFAHNLNDAELLEYFEKCSNYTHDLTKTELILKAKQDVFERLLPLLVRSSSFKIRRCIDFYLDNSISLDKIKLALNYEYSVYEFLNYYKSYNKWMSNKVKDLFELCREDFNKFKYNPSIRENLSYIDNMIFI